MQHRRKGKRNLDNVSSKEGAGRVEQLPNGSGGGGSQAAPGGGQQWSCTLQIQTQET